LDQHNNEINAVVSQVQPACQLIAIALQTFLIGVFFFGSHPQVFDPLSDYSPLDESRLVSTKEFIEIAALRRGFKSDGSQGQESFLASAA
jgi:hypothetical protein